MKQNYAPKSILGVTLLEIMLVLGIAGMIIVMSIRYYQTATSAQQTNTIMEQIQGLTVAADNIAQGSTTGSYSGLTGSMVAPLLPTGTVTPWNGSISIAPSSTSYVVTITSVPAAVCPVLKSRLNANSHYVSASTCSTTAAVFTYSYTPLST